MSLHEFILRLSFTLFISSDSGSRRAR